MKVKFLKEGCVVRKLVWLIASVIVVCAVLTFANVSPQQQLLTQCADQILDYNLCIYMNTVQRYCCIPYAPNVWRKALCYHVEVYMQYRQPPLPPSVYYANRRYCPSAYELCTPMVRLRCPSP